jgi:hypothetical protein
MSVPDPRVDRVARTVYDLAGGALGGLRILDLACNDGNFAIRLAQLGAREVVGVEGRDQVEQAITKSESLGLANVRFEQGDVRYVTPETHGTFDVVLCLGILYHLDTPELFKFAETVASLTQRFAIIETQVSLSRKRKERYDHHVFWGKSYPEDTSQPGASLDNAESFWLTKSSLLNLLMQVGFTTVSEIQVPAIPTLNAWRDHVALIAVKGGRLDFDPPEPVSWPERLPRNAHPSQGIRWRVADRIKRVRGGGSAEVFRSTSK